MAAAYACRPSTSEEELALRLCGLEERRDADRRVIEALGRGVDHDRLFSFLEEQRIVALAGTRLDQLLPEELPAAFLHEVDEHTAHNRRRGMLFDHLSREVCRALEATGVQAVPLKGAGFAQRVYGDLGLRSAQSDIDVLVKPALLDQAVAILVGMGYRVHDHVDWHDGLPHYHSRLVKFEPVETWVELHWRLHWYEESFAQGILDRSGADAAGLRCLQPADELAALLLMFARDGYTGLRSPADIALWWDRYGSDLPPSSIDRVIDAHPCLAGAIVAAADVLEREVGVPADRLIDPATKRPKRARLASRLADWSASGDETESAVNVTLNDLLLTPRGAYITYLRHYFWQPVEHYRLVYGWPREQALRNQVRRAIHAGGRVARTAMRYTRRLWQLRGGMTWSPVP